MFSIEEGGRDFDPALQRTINRIKVDVATFFGKILNFQFASPSQPSIIANTCKHQV
jgi:hypothetical protein